MLLDDPSEFQMHSSFVMTEEFGYSVIALRNVRKWRIHTFDVESFGTRCWGYLNEMDWVFT